MAKTSPPATLPASLPQKSKAKLKEKTTKVFQHGGSQAVRIPKDFRFAGKEVTIERRGDEIILREKPVVPKLKTLGDVARYLREKFPDGGDWPDIERPTEFDKRDLDWTKPADDAL